MGKKLRLRPCLGDSNQTLDASIAMVRYVCISSRFPMARGTTLNTYHAKIQSTAAVGTISGASIGCPCSR